VTVEQKFTKIYLLKIQYFKIIKRVFAAFFYRMLTPLFLITLAAAML